MALLLTTTTILLPAIRRMSGNDFVFEQDSAPRSCNSWTAASGNAKLSCAKLWPPNSLDHNPLYYAISAVTQHRVCHRQIHRVDELKRRLIDVSAVSNSWFLTRLLTRGKEDFECVFMFNGGHFEYSLWTDNVDFVHICYIQCDLFHRYIFNYEIMPATLANAFLFILQGSALADLRYGGRF